jgi:serine/threonine protein kinase
MLCPRCGLVEIPEATGQCVVCGFSAGADAAVATAEVPTDAATELDARRELSRDFRIEALLEQRPGLIVYHARDSDDRAVVVKVLPRAALKAAGAEDRFGRAAQAAAGLDHPHIVRVSRCGTTANFVWYSTPRIEGRPLAELLRAEGPLELNACLRILEQVGSALDYAHRRGVVHGSLTPANVIIDANQWALVGDFVVAGVWSPGPEAPGAFPAPEPTPAADQSALAVVAYECLRETPAVPEEAGSILAELPPGIPVQVSEALRRALNDRPGERFPTVLDFIAALDGTQSGRTTPRFARAPQRGPGASVVIIDFDEEPRRVGRRLVAAAAVLITLGAGAAWLATSSVPATSAILRPDPAPRPPATAPAPQIALPSPPPRDELAPSEDVPAAEDVVPAKEPVRATRLARPGRRETAPRPPSPAPREPEAPARADVGAQPTHLSVNAIPWGNVYLDGRLVGNTPLINLLITPGARRLRVERRGFQPFEQIIEVAPGQQLRVTDIVLRKVGS